MKKIKLLVLAAITAVAFNSCSQMNAQKYNETVVGLYSGYTNKLSSDLDKIAAEGTSKEAAEVALKNMTASTDSCLKVMNSLKPSDDAKDFHNKIVAVMNTVKTEVIPEMQKMASLKGTEDVTEYNKLIDGFNATNDKITKLEDEAGKAQEAFAQKVGMKVQ
jgi:hypothetical protein